MIRFTAAAHLEHPEFLCSLEQQLRIALLCPEMTRGADLNHPGE